MTNTKEIRLIAGRIKLMMGVHWENARESYIKEGSEAFNALMRETVRPTEILCELIKSRESTDEQFREAAVLRAQKELGKEMQKRIKVTDKKEGST